MFIKPTAKISSPHIAVCSQLKDDTYLDYW